MSERELRRGEVLNRVKRGELKLVEGAERLELSYRQAKRLYQRYKQGGTAALKHGNAARPSNRAKPQPLRERVLELVRERYGGGEARGLGPTLAAEHLASEYGLEVDHETLRRWMKQAGLWQRRRKRSPHRKRRTAKAHFGELLQLDGSHHRWLEERGPQACLMNLVDDASGRGMFVFADEETTWAAADLLERWVRRHGIPQALYCDWKNVYLRRATARETIEGVEPRTQFGRMCEKLGIRLIGASSPEAKGRVERHHGTHQDRLVKKMRLAGIADYEAANRFLEGYEREHNERFGRRPAAAADFHLRLPRRLDLRRVFCLEQERVVSRDFVVRFENRWLQLQVRRNQPVWAGTRVQLEQWRDGSLHVAHEGRQISFEEIAQPAPRPQPTAVAQRTVVRVKPKADHPWKRFPAVAKRGVNP
jgi:transposase